MRTPFLAILSLLLLTGCKQETPEESAEFLTPFELSEGTQTATYDEILDFYFKLAREFPSIHIQTLGDTDAGKPLHLVSYNPEANFNFQKLAEEKTVILINNGIHPGEPDGIDASMMLFRDLASGKLKTPENVVLVTIPVYNIGGALNRNSHSRANQNGPESYGFRGNARNFDLNRDFIKQDTKNAATFSTLFHQVKPDLFVDTHVSNGADYQYTLTHLFTQHNKLGGALGTYMKDSIMKGLEDRLLKEGWDITPYVNVHGSPPDNGFSQFMDYPRYSTGYAALWNVPGLMIETHMLKPYEQRVTGTYTLLRELIMLAAEQGNTLMEKREAAFNKWQPGSYYPLAWEIDSTRYRNLNFKGFEADTISSEVTGKPRLRYDREKPFEQQLPYFDEFSAVDSVQIPAAYILPRAYSHLLPILERNQVRYRRLEADTTLQVEVYHISTYETYTTPYEGHYPHYSTTVKKSRERASFQAGDIFIPMDQRSARYVLEVLEPQANDSFFNWNFFDSILGRKEGFSAYVFEETAAAMLESDPALKEEFEAMKEEHPDFAGNAREQLNWLYERSPHSEAAFLRYPVYRVPANDQ